MKIIGLAGTAGTGKSTLAEYLTNRHDAATLSFADPLYGMLAGFLGIERDALLKMAQNREWKERALVSLGNKSPRQMLQWLGDWVRERCGNDWLVQHLEWRLHELADVMPGTHLVLITDVRLEMEADWLRSKSGTIWHLLRSQATPVAGHRTEAGVPIHPRADHLLLNNGSLEELFEQAEAALAHSAGGLKCSA